MWWQTVCGKVPAERWLTVSEKVAQLPMHLKVPHLETGLICIPCTRDSESLNPKFPICTSSVFGASQSICMDSGVSPLAICSRGQPRATHTNILTPRTWIYLNTVIDVLIRTVTCSSKSLKIPEILSLESLECLQLKTPPQTCQNCSNSEAARATSLPLGFHPLLGFVLQVHNALHHIPLIGTARGLLILIIL